MQCNCFYYSIMTVSKCLFFIVLCCYLLCPSQACEEDSKFPVDNQISELNETIPNIFLCRMCGLSQDDKGSLLDTTSPFSLSVRNETIFFERNKNTIATTISVQKLRNPAGNVFDVVTLRKSSCKGVGKVNPSLLFTMSLPDLILMTIVYESNSS